MKNLVSKLLELDRAVTNGHTLFVGSTCQQAADLLAGCEPFLKENETPAECIERHRKDGDALLALLAKEKRKNELRIIPPLHPSIISEAAALVEIVSDDRVRAFLKEIVRIGNAGRRALSVTFDSPVVFNGIEIPAGSVCFISEGS